MNVIRSSILGAVLFGVVSLSAAGEPDSMTQHQHRGATGDIDVMTQNQYLGADLAPLLEAATSGGPFDPMTFNNALVEALTKIAASRPAERASALAEEIARRRPDVVGLQEAYTFECTPIPSVQSLPNTACHDPLIKDAFTDHLQDTGTALREKYVVAGRVTNLKVGPIPFQVNGSPALLSIADRDAILVRTDVPVQRVNFACSTPSDDGCHYLTRPPDLVLGDITIALVRGFLAVDVAVKGRQYRVFNTHLEQRLLAPTLPETRLLQVGQAKELVSTALATWSRWDGLSKTVIIVGDINSDPGDPKITLPDGQQVMTPYQIFMSNGFTDVWTLRPHPKPGLTCCQAEDLTNGRSELYERIDMIFSLPRPSHVMDVKLLGNKKRDKTDRPPHGGLWPSDHAALAATLQFK
ncbi:MAG: endonuclease/exonuclease/phosphatase family protein [Nitrospira sp.]